VNVLILESRILNRTQDVPREAGISFKELLTALELLAGFGGPLSREAYLEVLGESSRSAIPSPNSEALYLMGDDDNRPADFSAASSSSLDGSLMGIDLDEGVEDDVRLPQVAAAFLTEGNSF